MKTKKTLFLSIALILITTAFIYPCKSGQAEISLEGKIKTNGVNWLIQANDQDYQIARTAILKTASNPYMIPLTKVQRNILSVFEKLDETWFTVSELEPKIKGTTDRWLRNQLDRLVEFNLLQKDLQQDETVKREKMIYARIKPVKINLPKTLD